MLSRTESVRGALPVMDRPVSGLVNPVPAPKVASRGSVRLNGFRVVTLFLLLSSLLGGCGSPVVEAKTVWRQGSTVEPSPPSVPATTLPQGPHQIVGLNDEGVVVFRQERSVEKSWTPPTTTSTTTTSTTTTLPPPHPCDLIAVPGPGPVLLTQATMSHCREISPYFDPEDLVRILTTVECESNGCVTCNRENWEGVVSNPPQGLFSILRSWNPTARDVVGPNFNAENTTDAARFASWLVYHTGSGWGHWNACNSIGVTATMVNVGWED